MSVAFAFSCTKCGLCCNSGPALSIDEVFKYQDVFISGLSWGGLPVSAKTVMPFKGDLVDAQKLGAHLESFCAASFADKGDMIYPHIYPVATGYTLAPGRSCDALAADGTCRLHDDKPTMCRSVPFDPAVPEDFQGIMLRRFEHDCMTKTDAPEAANVIFRDGAITNPSCRDDYNRRLAVMRKDQKTLAIASYFLTDDGSWLAPSRAQFISTADRGGWIETSMAALIYILLKNREITQQTAESYLHAQNTLIETQIAAALQRRDSSERDRTMMMRDYLVPYRKMLNEDGKLKTALLSDVGIC